MTLKICRAHELNARRQGALEAHAQAELDAVFDAAAALLDAGPERARPSLRCGAKRRIKRRPPPQSRPSRSRRLRSWTAVVLERRHASHPHVRLLHARAAAQRHSQRHPLPGIGPPAKPRASTRQDPAIEALFLLIIICVTLARTEATLDESAAVSGLPTPMEWSPSPWVRSL